VLFAGSPALAVPILRRLESGGPAGAELASVELVGVLTNPDAPRGRSGKSEPTEVAVAADAISAERAGRGLPPLPQLKFERLGPEAREAVLALRPELLVSAAYGHIFGPKFLALFPEGGINYHPSLLPRYRGATPIPAAILARDAETGFTVQRLAAGMDEGDILLQECFPLDFSETTASLSAVAADRGAELVARAVELISSGNAVGRRQDPAEASYCSMISKEDGRIDWTRSASELDARIRAFTPWPLSFTEHRGQTLFLLEARVWSGGRAAPAAAAPAAGAPGTVVAGTVAGIDKAAGILVQTGDGLLAIGRLQYGAKKALDWRSFLNGARDFIGSRLGADGSSV